ncbi:hypothetical protein XENOCAPTIV_016282 [Xenoophorus captivus]|uniref:Adenylate cyclase-stimulating G alpha protein n=1 Tax=Xenoophorus captivus TaxID=1517983 RepID=A0ABV0R0T4_9TELE
MSTLTPPIPLGNPDNQFRLDYIKSIAPLLDFEYTEVKPHLHTGLKAGPSSSSAIQPGQKCTFPLSACFERSNEYQLIDCAHFLDQLESVRRTDYTPTDQGFLRPGFRWTKSISSKFTTVFCFVGSKEVKVSELLLGILISMCPMIGCRFLKTISVILFLNKQDVLADKILAGKSKLEDYFPEFTNYQVPPDCKNIHACADKHVRITDHFPTPMFVLPSCSRC